MNWNLRAFGLDRLVGSEVRFCVSFFAFLLFFVVILFILSEAKRGIFTSLAPVDGGTTKVEGIVLPW